MNKRTFDQGMLVRILLKDLTQTHPEDGTQ